MTHELYYVTRPREFKLRSAEGHEYQQIFIYTYPMSI